MEERNPDGTFRGGHAGLKGPLSSKFIDLSARIFGRLLVISIADRRGRNIRWNCYCECGNRVIRRGVDLTRRRDQSCGCLAHELTGLRSRTHGRTNTAEYKIWRGMIQRCTNRRDPNWLKYGARGIGICPRWRKFENFFLDMGERPTAEHSIDRINTFGNYEPTNCRWATQFEQDYNRRNTVWIEIEGQKIPLKIWCKQTGMNYMSVRTRLKFGWSPERIASTPMGPSRWNNKLAL